MSASIKHRFHIVKIMLTRMLYNNSELKEMKNYNNKTLNSIIKAIKTIKISNYNDTDLKIFEKLESYRLKLMNNNSLVSYKVFGSNKVRTVSDVCKKDASKKKWCMFYYYLIKNLQSQNFLEIGTNLGVSGFYILEGLKNSSKYFFLTLEGLPQYCDIANNYFSKISPASNYKILKGLYKETFPKVFNENKKFDTIFIDGNHTKDATIKYFEQLKNIVQYPAVFLFDDIYWSDGMEEAWEYIKKDKDVTFTIDLIKLGIVVLEKNFPQSNVNFNLIL